MLLLLAYCFLAQTLMEIKIGIQYNLFLISWRYTFTDTLLYEKNNSDSVDIINGPASPGHHMAGTMGGRRY